MADRMVVCSAEHLVGQMASMMADSKERLDWSWADRTAVTMED